MDIAARHNLPLAVETAKTSPDFHPRPNVSASRLVTDFSIIRDDYHLRIVPKEGPLRQDVNRLVERMYEWRGLNTDQSIVPDLHREQTTIAACKGDRVFGTLTVALDSGDGLLADTLYRPQIDAARESGAQVCEVTRLAMDPELGTPQALAALFHIGVIIARSVHGKSDVFVEVNPRHAPYYRRMMGYSLAGPNLTCPRVGAPAVLLRLSLDHAEQQARQHGGTNNMKRNGLYGLFFSPAEQTEILRHILAGSIERRATRRPPVN
jgi:hypothetical protein